MPTNTEFERLYAALNKEQKIAVDTLDGPVMVLAGPGTGKTQTLAMRIANILQKTEMDPWNILCLTFTESGVVAMRRRLISIIGPAAYGVRIHTFHSFCNDIMQERREWFATSRNWQLLSDAERVEMFQRIIDTLPASSALKPFHDPYMFFGDIVQNIKSLKQEDISPDAYTAIVASLDTFTASIAEDTDAFFSLTPKERTDAACTAIHSTIITAAQKAGVAQSIVQYLEYQFERYQAAQDAAEGAREQSKARTALKNSLKAYVVRQRGAMQKQYEMAKVYAAYEKQLRDTGRYDYEDMITLVVQELKANEELLAHCQEQFQFILVDEYQDTNGAQNEIVQLLGSFDDSPNVFVVGDDKQSIYRFQGASLSNMLSFYQRYKTNVKVVSLSHNYRSQKAIIDAADALISHNVESLAAHIPGITQSQHASSPHPQRPLEYRQAASYDEELYMVSQYISRLIHEGASPADIAVLYRYNKDGDQLLPVLKRQGIPARIEMGQDIFTSIPVQQWIRIFRTLADGKQEDAISRIIHYPWWGISSVDALKATHAASSAYLPLLTVMGDEKRLRDAGITAPEPIVALALRLAHWRSLAEQLPLMEWLEYVIADSHFLSRTADRDDSVETLRAIKTLLNEARKVSHMHDSVSLADFVRHLSFLQQHGIGIFTPEWEGSTGAVHLMTAHRSKGLEFPHVIIIHASDKQWGGGRTWSHVPLPEGIIPYDFVVSSENNEDERRLFYVALTRAKQTVALLHSTHSATGKETVPSVFVSELPKQLMHETPSVPTVQSQHERLVNTLLTPFPLATDADGREYIRSLLTTYTMSITHLNNYLECPRKFFIRNIMRIPFLKTRSLAMGSAVHDALRDLFEDMQQTHSTPSEKWLLDVYERHLRREPLAHTDFADALSRGKDALASYYKEYNGTFFSDVLLEHNFHKYNVHVAGVPITGKLDKVEILDRDAKTVNVVDYKTGNADTAREKLRRGGDYFRQLTFYKLLCDNAPEFGYTMVSGEIDFVESTAKGHVKKRVEITEDDTRDLTETIVRVWKEIQNLEFLDPEKACPKNKQCEYCYY